MNLSQTEENKTAAQQSDERAEAPATPAHAQAAHTDRPSQQTDTPAPVEEPLGESPLPSGEEPSAPSTDSAQPTDREASASEAEAPNTAQEEVSQGPEQESSSEKTQSEETPAGQNHSSGGTEGSDEDEDSEDDEDGEGYSERKQPQSIDFSNYSKTELVTWMREQAQLTEEEDLLHRHHLVRDARERLDELVQQEVKEQLDRFLAEGGNEIDFQAKADPEKQSFYDAYRKFQDKRKGLIEARNKEREENLKRKQAILEQLKELTDSADTKESLQKLRGLQEEWRQVGPVPPNEIHNLRQNYHFLIDKFYTNRSLNFELKELDRKKNLAQKQELVQQMRQLVELPDGIDAARQLYKLQDEFFHLGPVPREQLDELMASYREASAAVLRKRDEEIKRRDEMREQFYQTKLEILEKIREIAALESDDPRVWVAKNKELGGWIEDWKKLGPVPRDKRKQLSADFREAVREFNRRKNEFFKQRKLVRNQNLEEKRKLCEEVETLAQEEDLAGNRKRVLHLQDRWKEIGPVPAKQSEKIWKRFQQACDSFFNKLHAEKDHQRQHERENLHQKQELIKRIEQMLEQASLEEDVDELVARLREEFEQIGYVPIKKKDSIRKQFNAVLGKLMRKFKDYGIQEPDLVDYKMKLDEMLNTEDGQKKLQQEERRLQHEIKRVEGELETIENNLQFFNAQSKGGASMRKQYEHKINALRNKARTERNKLKLIRQVNS